MAMDYGQAIQGALSQGNILEAARLAEAALDAGWDDPLFCNLAAWKRETNGDFAGAEAMLQRALSLAPDDPFTLIGLGSLRRRQGRVDEAIALLDAAIAALPDNCGAKLERAYAFEDAGLLERAAEDYRKAVELDSHAAPAHAGLASVLSRLGRVEQAGQEAEIALGLDPANVTALCARARCALEEGRPEAAILVLSALPEKTDISETDRIIVLGLLGDAHARLGQVEPAFSFYSSAKLLFSGTDRRDKNSVSQRTFIENISHEIETSRSDDWLPAIPRRGESKHAFLIGYPRSGTTLLESILAAAPGVETAEEQPTLHAADLAFLAPSLTLDDLKRVDAASAEFFQAAYWDGVRRLGIDVGGKLLSHQFCAKRGSL